jgi:hypothetical protein
VGGQNILYLLPNTNGRMEGNERLFEDRRDELAANSLQRRGVELHQVLTFKVDKAFLNSRICVKDSQKGRKCALAGSRFTQYSQCFAAPHDEADARECDIPLIQSNGIGHAKVRNLKEFSGEVRILLLHLILFELLANNLHAFKGKGTFKIRSRIRRGRADAQRSVDTESPLGK